MLGRQQIAGIPTAISELFKNAYDAYAQRVEADVYRSDGLFVLRDNGIGMTREDFVSRWMTLGTDSKVRGGGLRPPTIPAGVRVRPTLGEKGIGRLAIATIGPITVALTRAMFPSNQDEIVYALFHWGMFELPGVNLEDIDVPVRSTPPTSLPNSAEILEMARSYRPTLERLRRSSIVREVDIISESLSDLDIDPSQIDKLLGGLSLVGPSCSGTHFLVKPVDRSIYLELDASRSSKDASNLVRLLIGFSNTMSPSDAGPPIETAFRDHIGDSSRDLIESNEFFTPAEFQNADHQVTGVFDEFGVFRGIISRYGEKSEHEIDYDSKGQTLACGPFRIKVAIVQGNSDATTLPDVDYEALKRKLDRIGGIYIYNDGIRVLPYGDNRFDFLEIERRRTLNVGRYFFSYRRMFGVIEIDRTVNAALQEKAGREGFRENRAFWQFKDVLKHFFIQLAADFFVTGGKYAEPFITRKNSLVRANAAARERAKEDASHRAAFRKALSEQMSFLDDGGIESEVAAIKGEFDAALTRSESSVPELRYELIAEIESEALSRIRTTWRDHNVFVRPGLGLTPSLRRDFDSYQDELAQKQLSVLEPMAAYVERAVSAARANLPNGETRNRRLELSIRRAIARSRSNIEERLAKLDNAISEISSRSQLLHNELTQALEIAATKAFAEVCAANLDELSFDEYSRARVQLEGAIEDLVADQERFVESLIFQLGRFQWNRIDGEVATDLDVASAVDERILALEERINADLELAQLGLFIQVIDHEFVNSIQSVRKSIERLRDWAKGQPAFTGLYEDVRTSFDVLDGYLRLFTPLQRRAYRRSTIVSGRRLFNPIKRLFKERLDDEVVTLLASDNFLNHELRIYPSTLFPVLVNLIDNALYWLERSPEPRVISLDVERETILVSNNGPSIAQRDQSLIFDPAFSRKPEGRGLGLWISRQILSRDGFILELLPPQRDMTVTFGISPEAPPESSAESEDIPSADGLA